MWVGRGERKEVRERGNERRGRKVREGVMERERWVE